MAHTDEACSAGREAQAIDGARLGRGDTSRRNISFEFGIVTFPQDSAVGDIPKLDRVVAAPRGNRFAVGTEGDTKHAIAVSFFRILLLVRLEFSNQCTAGSVPKL